MLRHEGRASVSVVVDNDMCGDHDFPGDEVEDFPADSMVCDPEEEALLAIEGEVGGLGVGNFVPCGSKGGGAKLADVCGDAEKS